MNKKSILGLLAVVMIAAVAALNVSLNSQKETLSDLAMENVEALASEKGISCYNYGCRVCYYFDCHVYWNSIGFKKCSYMRRR